MYIVTDTCTQQIKAIFRQKSHAVLYRNFIAYEQGDCDDILIAYSPDPIYVSGYDIVPHEEPSWYRDIDLDAPHIPLDYKFDIRAHLLPNNWMQNDRCAREQSNDVNAQFRQSIVVLDTYLQRIRDKYAVIFKTMHQNVQTAIANTDSCHAYVLDVRKQCRKNLVSPQDLEAAEKEENDHKAKQGSCKQEYNNTKNKAAREMRQALKKHGLDSAFSVDTYKPYQIDKSQIFVLRVYSQKCRSVTRELYLN